MNNFSKPLPDSVFALSVSLALQILKISRGTNKQLKFKNVSEVTISKWTNPKSKALPSLIQLHELLEEQGIPLIQFLQLIDAIEKIHHQDKTKTNLVTDLKEDNIPANQ